MATEAENRETYLVNMHAIQSCIALKMSHDKTFATPKDLRVGIDSAHITNHAVAELLIAKGVFTLGEYFEQLVKSSEVELAKITEEAQQRLGDTLTKLHFE